MVDVRFSAMGAVTLGEIKSYTGPFPVVPQGVRDIAGNGEVDFV